MAEKPPVVLTIAGFDPSSGAGVTADIKTIAAHGCYGVACITAMTVQSTAGVQRVEAVDPALVTETLEELAADLEIAAVHIGMLGSGKVVKAVADFLAGASAGRSTGQARLAEYCARSDPQVFLRRRPSRRRRNQAADRPPDPPGGRHHPKRRRSRSTYRNQSRRFGRDEGRLPPNCTTWGLRPWSLPEAISKKPWTC